MGRAFVQRLMVLVCFCIYDLLLFIAVMFSKKPKGRSIVRDTQITTEWDSLVSVQGDVSITAHEMKCLEQQWVLVSIERGLCLCTLLAGEALRIFFEAAVALL